MNDTVHIYDMIIYDIHAPVYHGTKGKGLRTMAAAVHCCIQGFNVWIPMQRLDLRKPSIPSESAETGNDAGYSSKAPTSSQDSASFVQCFQWHGTDTSWFWYTLYDFFWVVGGAIDAVDDMDGENVAKTRVVNRGIDFLKAACEFADEVSCFTLFHCLLRALQDLFPRSKPNLAGILRSWGMHHWIWRELQFGEDCHACQLH